MVKRIIGLSLAALLFAFVLPGCSNPISATNSQGSIAERDSAALSEDSAPQQRQGQDYTVEVPAYDIDSASIALAGSAMAEGSFPYPCQTVSQLDEHSSAIITGTVTNREFFSHDGLAYTKLDVVIDQCVKGDFLPGDIISVVQYGGYISIADIAATRDNGFRFADVPEDQWATTYFKQSSTGDDFPEVGEWCAYFLETDPLFPEAYIPINDYEGTFFMGVDGRFVRHNLAEGYVPDDGEASATLKANGDEYPNNAGNEVIDSFTLDDLFSYFG